ncbi:DUF6056 family protein [Helicobacter canadensis]|uniref:Uncharacterized protein n=1 Tax=Helicobacter canadensis MIT 98-5491 TaxID=537970 RepID=C5ZXN9_9HELI|nr:DUF6056 family protein [Helicobacter canadensis]EES89907.1 hypothetical protein HCAN_1197 [Helicobacter canadensis MIT 98-5491]EFR49053.1 hypothetical protein HCMG_01226 [Helicobacter canadensis MIT 98-5491]STP02593.1 Uncharacterised protein [Helicobacter canadensis]
MKLEANTKNNQFLFILGLFLILFIWNLLFLPQSDDFAHYFSAIDDNKNFLSSYFDWNGRFGELLSTTFFGKIYFSDYSWVFDFLNAGVGVIYLCAFFVLCFGKLPYSKEDFMSFAFIFGFICIFGHFGAIFLWGAGASNYLWGVGFILCFLLPFRLYWENNGTKKTPSLKVSIFLSLSALIFGFLAGMSSEFIGIAIIAFLFLLFFVATIKKWKLPIWQYLGFLSISIGWLALFLSPGSRKRSEVLAETNAFIPLSDFFDLPFLDMILLINQTFNSPATSMIFRIFLIIFVAFFIVKMGYIKNFNKYSYINKAIVIFLFLLFCLILLAFSKHICAFLLYIALLFCIIKLIQIDNKYFIFLGLFIAWLLMDLSLFQLHGHIAPRAELGKDLTLIAMSVFMFRELYANHPRFIGKLIIGQFIIGILFASLGSYSVWKQSNYIENASSKEGMQSEVVLPKDIRFNKIIEKYFLDYSLITNDPQNWVNQVIAKYYNVKSLYIEK